MTPEQNADTERLRHLLFRVALAVTNPDRDHVDRCVDVLGIVGSAEDWRPLNDGDERPIKLLDTPLDDIYDPALNDGADHG